MFPFARRPSLLLLPGCYACFSCSQTNAAVYTARKTPAIFRAAVTFGSKMRPRQSPIPPVLRTARSSRSGTNQLRESLARHHRRLLSKMTVRYHRGSFADVQFSTRVKLLIILGSPCETFSYVMGCLHLTEAFTPSRLLSRNKVECDVTTNGAVTRSRVTSR